MRARAIKELRPFASLSSTLLARKGQARPAMRPSVAHHADDLGWNDMGHDEKIVAVEAIPEIASPEIASEDSDLPMPAQLRAAIEAEMTPVAVKTEEMPAPASALRPIQIKSRLAAQPVPAKSKVAFTLRLDAERHLRLRLGCTLGNRSAQQLVTEALDAFLEAIPQINELAVQIPPSIMNRRC